MPDDLSLADAVALQTQGLTAAYLAAALPLREKTVFIHGATGGVGSLLLQLARRNGARIVAGVAGTERLALVAESHADFAVDYQRSGWETAVREATGGRGPDVIFDAAGGSVSKASLGLLADAGTLVVYGGRSFASFALSAAELQGLLFKNQSLRGFALPTLLTTDGLNRTFEELATWVKTGALHVRHFATFAMSDAVNAHRAFASPSCVGKVTLSAI